MKAFGVCRSGILAGWVLFPTAYQQRRLEKKNKITHRQLRSEWDTCRLGAVPDCLSTVTFGEEKQDIA